VGGALDRRKAMTTFDQSTRIITRSGFLFDVRSARPDDEAALAQFFTHVTPEDMRFRFLTGLREVGHDRLAAMTNVDHRQTENFLAFVDDGAEIIATAMLACDADMKRGEVAIAIRNDYKNDGVSWELMKHVAAHAKSIGVETLESIESRDNHAAINLEREMGWTTSSYPGDASLMLVQKNLGKA
jgi:N-acetylglutamate synthase-like GNAT family acetyltransferase